MGADNRPPSRELWDLAERWLVRGWLQNHARSKPRGYAGDHEMLARIYDASLCADPLGQLFDRYFQAQAAPQAVRYRMQMMADWIVETIRMRRAVSGTVAEGPVKIGIVGSAFGAELREALRKLTESERHSLQAALLDLDPTALEYAREQLTGWLPKDRLSLSSGNLFRMADRPSMAAPLAGSDLLFCPGLFDYFDDATAAKFLKCLVDQLAPGGRLIVFQFAPHNPTRAYMEWFGNWYLTYRDRDALRDLVQAAELTDVDVAYGSEPSGVDLFAQITRNC